jgi:hypothetical protein
VADINKDSYIASNAVPPINVEPYKDGNLWARDGQTVWDDKKKMWGQTKYIYKPEVIPNTKDPYIVTDESEPYDSGGGIWKQRGVTYWDSAKNMWVTGDYTYHPEITVAADKEAYIKRHNVGVAQNKAEELRVFNEGQLRMAIYQGIRNRNTEAGVYGNEQASSVPYTYQEFIPSPAAAPLSPDAIKEWEDARWRWEAENRGITERVADRPAYWEEKTEYISADAKPEWDINIPKWEEEVEYISAEDKPEWEQYRTPPWIERRKEAEQKAIVAPMPQGDKLRIKDSQRVSPRRDNVIQRAKLTAAVSKDNMTQRTGRVLR